MLHLLSLVLICCDDAATAGSAYREAQEALTQGRYAEAVSKLQEAVRFEPRETEKLLYRDREGRHGDPYYPHFLWGQARSLQAGKESDPLLQRQLLREALFHLDLTDHAGAAALLGSVRKELAALEQKAGTPPVADDTLPELRRRLVALCDQEHFEECLALLSREKVFLDRHPADRAQLAELVESQRRSVLLRYDHAMILTLETIAGVREIDKPRLVLQFLKSALVPPAVTEHPDARFVWLREFHRLYEREIPRLETLALGAPEAVLECAQAFEACGLRALDAGFWAGFRAALNIAEVLRSASLGRLATGQDDAQLERILAEAEQGLRRREESLSHTSLPPAELASVRAGVLTSPAQALLKSRLGLQRRQQLQEDLGCWLSAARHALGNPGTMASPSALRDMAQEGAALVSREGWKEAPAGFRARALYVRGLLEAVAGCLEGGLVAEQAGSLVQSARTLDAAVDQSWKDFLSPRLQGWLASLR